jgi:hypothetical protein
MDKKRAIRRIKAAIVLMDAAAADLPIDGAAADLPIYSVVRRNIITLRQDLEDMVTALEESE